MENLYFGRSGFRKQKTFLLIYDIPDDRRRRKMAKLMESYGYRVQYSAFECSLSKQKYFRLLSQIPEIIKESDNVRIYPMFDDSDVICWNGDINYLKSDVLIC